MTMPIPEWDALGVLPPYDEDNPTARVRSPYRVSLVDLVERFASSPERVAVMHGFLAYRAALHRLGFVAGFQWLDGSFSEDIERIEGRPPHDVDVVSFVHQSSVSAASLEGDEAALDHDAAKELFLVDGYFIELDELSSDELVEWSAYWYSLWSHRRTKVWKGFLRVELTPEQDADAAVALALRAATLGEPI